jgi:endonuclease/exonuclease/phosphatase (EEP) superfamily protein YafD
MIAESDADVVAIQEAMTAEELAAIMGPDWNVAGTFGITIASRFDILEKRTFTGSVEAAWRTVAIDYCLAAPEGPIDLVIVHLETPREGLAAVKDDFWGGITDFNDNLQQRSSESAAASRWVASLPGPTIVAGDMNMPSDSLLFRRDWSSFTDAFAAAGWGYGYTYGYGTSGRRYGQRIDHILVDAGWHVERAWVGRHIGSDHRALMAELARVKR